jgi:SPP1 family phage portal protein
MRTYQDLEPKLENDNDLKEFVKRSIDEYRGSELYTTALHGEEYYKKLNTTIVSYQKTITTVTGGVIPDEWSANHKVTSGFFKRFVTQQVGFSLGNGVSFDHEGTKKKLGGVKFDRAIQKGGKWACIGGVAYLFWNNDHVEVFKAKEFVPYLDEENGALRAGIKFWRLDNKKPLCAILYLEDGYRELQWDKENPSGTISDKQGYIKITKKAEVDDEADIEWKNYGSFPIVPLWANEERQSELVGIQEGIDAYDLIKNGFENDLDEAQLYWLIRGAGGMDDPDLAHFMERLRRNKVAAPMDDQDVQPVTVNLPYEARERLLDRIENDLYRDFMAVNTDRIASGAVTATQIKASYSPQDAKADDFEYQVGDAIDAIMALAGVEDTYGFERGYVVNVSETITNTLACAQMLPQDYIIKKLLTVMGDGDMADSIIKQMQQKEIDMMRAMAAGGAQGVEVAETALEGAEEQGQQNTRKKMTEDEKLEAQRNARGNERE